MDDKKSNPQPQKTSEKPESKAPGVEKAPDPRPSGDSFKHQGDKLQEAVE